MMSTVTLLMAPRARLALGLACGLALIGAAVLVRVDGATAWFYSMGAVLTAVGAMQALRPGMGIPRFGAGGRSRTVKHAGKGGKPGVDDREAGVVPLVDVPIKPLPRPQAMDAGLVMVFDFDVICDSFEEIMMLAWYAHTGEPVERFVDRGLTSIPLPVVQRFDRCRPFMRHLAHFLVPLVSEDCPATPTEFSARFEALAPAEVERFASAARDYRTRLRQAFPERWSAWHHIERRLAHLIPDAYIVTSHDMESVSDILRAHGVGIDDNRVFGSLRDTTSALAEIADRESRLRRDVILIDDSIENCIAARSAGFSPLWASWGAFAQGDSASQMFHRIPVVTVDDFMPASVSGA
jgi:hypothetical protein